MKQRLVHLGAITIFCALAVGITSFHYQSCESAATRPPATKPAKEGPSLSRALRPVYPYSIIAGGAYSAAELRYAVRRDPVVREHYGNFNLERVRLVQLTDDRNAYASYRVKERVFWTRKKLRIPRGEVLLTDGLHFARTRCGNQLADTPQKSIAKQEPTAELSLPPFAPDQIRQFAFAEPPIAQIPLALPPVESEELPMPASVVPDAKLPLSNPPPADWPTAPVGTYPPPSIPVSAGVPMPPTAPVVPPNSPQSPGNPPPTSPDVPVPEPTAVCLLVVAVGMSGFLLFRVSRNRNGSL